MKTAKIKTAEAIGPALDWLVAKVENEEVIFDGRTLRHPASQFSDKGCFKPSEDWAQGGPIIEREFIELGVFSNTVWGAQLQIEVTDGDDIIPENIAAYGPTALIAAMRCYVTSKLGDEVEIPEELT